MRKMLLVVAVLGMLRPLPCAAQAPADPWGSPPAPAESHSPLRDAAVDVAWLGGAAGLDLASTRYGLSRCATCREANPLAASAGTALALKVGATAVAGWGCYELRRHGHPRGAKWLRWGIVAVWSGAAVNNVIRARR